MHSQHPTQYTLVPALLLSWLQNQLNVFHSRRNTVLHSCERNRFLIVRFNWFLVYSYHSIRPNHSNNLDIDKG